MEPRAVPMEQHTAHDAILLREVRPEDDAAVQTPRPTYYKYLRQRNTLNAWGCRVGDMEGHRRGFLEHTDSKGSEKMEQKLRGQMTWRVH